MISVCDQILAILNNGEQAADCIEWAEKEEYPIYTLYSFEVTMQKAQSIVNEWVTANLQKSKNTLSEGVDFPALSKQFLTVKDLYEYLGTLLASIQEAQVYHVEFGALTQTTSVKYDPKIAGLILGQFQ